MLSSGAQGELLSWDLNKEKPQATLLYRKHNKNLLSIAVSGYGECVYLVGLDRFVQSWHLPSASLSLSLPTFADFVCTV